MHDAAMQTEREAARSGRAQETASRRQRQDTRDQGPRAQQLATLQARADGGPHARRLADLAEMLNPGQKVVQRVLGAEDPIGTSEPAIQTPRESMQQLGTQALRSGQRSMDEIYDRYSEFQQPAPLPSGEFTPYLESLAQIDSLSSPLVSSYPQREDSHSNRVTTSSTVLENPRQRARDRILNDFYRAEGRGEKANDPTLARISLRLNPSRAMEAWLFISRQLVGGNPYVTSAKIAGPEAINTRSDSVILYLSTNHEDIAAQIAASLVAQLGQGVFVAGVPSGMKELVPGIGFAERHPEFSSHGEGRAKAVELALAAFDVQLDRLQQVGIVPDEETQIDMFNRQFLPWGLNEVGISSQDPSQNIDEMEM
jgi:HopA1 effector protein family